MQFSVIILLLICIEVHCAAYEKEPVGRSNFSDHITLIGFEPNEVTLKQFTKSQKTVAAIDGNRITRRVSTVYYIFISGATPERRENMIDAVISIEKAPICDDLFEAFMSQLNLQELTSEQFELLSKPEISILEKYTESVMPQKKAVSSPPILRSEDAKDQKAQYKEQNCTRFDLGIMQMIVPNATTAEIIKDFLARPNIQELQRRGELLLLLKDLCRSIKPSAFMISDEAHKIAFESEVLESS